VRRLLLLPALGLMLAACGGSGEASKPVATTQVLMPKSYRFDPKTIEVEAGATVTWRNEDNFTHTVAVEGQEDREVEQGESVSITFREPGSYAYVCTLHSHDMKGKVIVR
jgi:plastocyanin